jgi:hypothetical protein
MWILLLIWRTLDRVLLYVISFFFYFCDIDCSVNFNIDNRGHGVGCVYVVMVMYIDCPLNFNIDDLLRVKDLGIGYLGPSPGVKGQGFLKGSHKSRAEFKCTIECFFFWGTIQ